MRFPKLLQSALLASALLAAVWCGTASAQGFFAESEALLPGSGLRLTFSDLSADSKSDSSLGTQLTVENSSIRSGVLRARLGFLGVGGQVESRKFEEQTETAFQSEDRDSSAGYLALVFENLILDDDALLLVASTGASDDTFNYQTYSRELDLTTVRQLGLVLQLGFLVLGYIEGHDRLTLEVTDPTITPIDETYEYDFNAGIAGIVLGDPNDVGASLILQRKKTPNVQGTQVHLEEGIQELRRVRIGLGVVSLEGSQTYFKEALTGHSSRETRERDVSLGMMLSDVLSMAITQKHILDEQSFTLAGLPSNFRSDRTESLLTFGLSF